jgi:hypothetical protein
MENVNVQNQTVKVNENKKSGKAAKVFKFLGKVLIGTAAAVGVDYVLTGGKGTQYVTTKGKELVSKVTTKKTPSPVVTTQNNQQGGQQRPHYENRPRPNYNGNNNRPANVVTE